VDHYADLRDQMTSTLDLLGLQVERAHHEVGTAGQAEINYRFDTLARAADKIMLFKYVIKNVAWANGKTATFMPKPIFGDNGSGMHCHQSLWKDGEPLFYDERGYGGLSDMARWYIGGLLQHASSLLAFTNPTTNSYRRLVPGYEAPVLLKHSQRNRSAAVRIPMYSPSPKSKRLEFRPPDPLANPYFAFPAMLMAGLDGIERELDPGEPIDQNLYDLPRDQLSDIRTVPTSLDEALDALEADHEFLTEGGVFTDDLIGTYIEFRREQSDRVKIRPHPYEFPLYFDG
jgi:glutamine synthetase